MYNWDRFQLNMLTRVAVWVFTVNHIPPALLWSLTLTQACHCRPRVPHSGDGVRACVWHKKGLNSSHPVKYS